MSLKPLMNEETTAAPLNVAPNTLAKWRVIGAGPKFIRCGRAIRYDPEDVDAWLSERKAQSTSEVQAA